MKIHQKFTNENALNLSVELSFQKRIHEKKSN